MGDVAPSSMDATSSELVSLSAKIMLGTIVVLFLMVALLFFAHIYAKWYWAWSSHEDPTIVSWRRRTARQGQQAAPATAQRRGLDPAALRSLPVESYIAKEFKDGLECAVCLSEVTEGEKIRLLPKCNHGFHLQCIDMWFHSHSTCPLCRNPVVSSQINPSSDNNRDLQENGGYSSSSESDSDDDYDGDHSSSYPSGAHSIEAQSFPTNVLFWGNQTQVSSLGVNSEEEQATTNAAASSSASSSSSSSSNNTNGNGRKRDGLVIDIPRELCDDCEDEAKTPVMSRLRSLKRLLSRGKRLAPSPRGSSSVEIEQV